MFTFFLLVVVLLVAGEFPTTTAASSTTTTADTATTIFDEDQQENDDNDDNVCLDHASSSTSSNDDCKVVASKQLDNNHNNNNKNNNNKNNSHNQSSSSSSFLQFAWKRGTLQPSDLPAPQTFDRFTTNTTITLPSSSQTRSHWMATGRVDDDTDNNNNTTNVWHLTNVVPPSTLQPLLKLLRSYNQYDTDPDTVDAMPTYEIFVGGEDFDDETNLQRTDPHSAKQFDVDPLALKTRRPFRKQLQALTQPIVDTTITPWVRQTLGHICNTTNERLCTPCYSLIRRYRYGERYSHAAHRDGHALATVVVGLSSYNINYRGGLYVTSDTNPLQRQAQRQFLPILAGQAVLHQRSVLHGVQVYDLPEEPQKTERWSWILWYKDSPTCQDYSHEWDHQSCVDSQGMNRCQQNQQNDNNNNKSKQQPLDASMRAAITAASLETGLELWRLADTPVVQALASNMQQAKDGQALSALGIARAYMHYVPSPLPYNLTQAKRYFAMAMRVNHANGYYGMAHVLLKEMQILGRAGKITPAQALADTKRWNKIITCLERSAYLYNSYAMFNLGLAHIYGYPGTNQERNFTRGVEWVIASGLPEGSYVASLYYDELELVEQRDWYRQHAHVMGYAFPWRQQARDGNGATLAGGQLLNLPWPPSPQGGDVPPEF